MGAGGMHAENEKGRERKKESLQEMPDQVLKKEPQLLSAFGWSYEVELPQRSLNKKGSNRNITCFSPIISV